MRILTRYVVREHVGPLLFALTALTSLLMLQYVARQLANLAGKGLPWAAIGKFFLLSLPFTIAMTMPMAVLVATLYAFGRMAAEQEITAFKATGVRVRSIMAPVLVSAFLLSLVMVVFNDQVLSRANHQLRILNGDIARTKPALGLREQSLNAISEQFVMKVAHSDAATGKMKDVVIYDLSKPLERKTIYADSGRISFAANKSDLELELFDGQVLELVKGDAKRLQRTFFRKQNVRVRGISQRFEISGSDNYKTDREQSICELHDSYIRAGKDYARLRKEYMEFAKRKEVASQVLKNPRTRPPRQALASMYCGAMASIKSLITTKSAHAAELPNQQSPIAMASQDTTHITQKDSITQAVPQPAQTPVPVVQQPLPQPPAVAQPAGGTQIPDTAPGIVPQTNANVAPPSDSAFVSSAFMATTSQLVDTRMTLDQVAVEIHKKFALSMACLVFVLFGPPIALRFPRGGVGVTIGVSILVFGLYYVCLMGGEALADNGRLPPFIAMWIANIVFGAAGIALLWRIEQTTDASRGGGLGEWWAERKALRALARAERAKRAAARTATPAGAP